MRMRHVQGMAVLLVVPGMVFVACRPGGGSVEPSAGDVNLVGTQWELISLDGEDPLAATRITLTFDEESIGGFAGCNGYGGPAIWTDDGVLTITEIAMTAQGCLKPEGVMEQEAAYIDAVQDAATYCVTEDQLAIENTAGEPILVFRLEPRADVNPADLSGTRGELITMNGDGPLRRAGSHVDFAQLLKGGRVPGVGLQLIEHLVAVAGLGR